MQSEESESHGSTRVAPVVIRRIDQLGRVVVPVELRRALGLRQGDLVETRLENGRVVMVKVEPECAVCGGSDDLIDMHEKHVCDGCIRLLIAKTEVRVPTAAE
jgi:AbrB family transcriptional regulator, transcriptional pleiotropic regulator of transition state genes